MFYKVEYTENGDWECMDYLEKYFRTIEDAKAFITDFIAEKWTSDQWEYDGVVVEQKVDITAETHGNTVVYIACVELYEDGKRTCGEDIEVCYLSECEFD